MQPQPRPFWGTLAALWNGVVGILTLLGSISLLVTGVMLAQANEGLIPGVFGELRQSFLGEPEPSTLLLFGGGLLLLSMLRFAAAVGLFQVRRWGLVVAVVAHFLAVLGCLVAIGLLFTGANTIAVLLPGLLFLIEFVLLVTLLLPGTLGVYWQRNDDVTLINTGGGLRPPMATSVTPPTALTPPPTPPTPPASPALRPLDPIKVPTGGNYAGQPGTPDRAMSVVQGAAPPPAPGYTPTAMAGYPPAAPPPVQQQQPPAPPPPVQQQQPPTPPPHAPPSDALPTAMPTGDPAPADPADPTAMRALPPPSVLAWLIERSGPGMGQEHRLHLTTTLGRDPARCDIVLHDGKVSAEHARVRYEDEQFVLYDLGSTNHVFVNEREVDRTVLHDGDVIRLGPGSSFAFLAVEVAG